MSKNIFLVIYFVLFYQPLFALSHDQKVSDFNQLVELLADEYGPLEYKEKKFGYNFSDLIEENRELIINSNSEEEFFYNIKKFVDTFKDSHLKVFKDSSKRKVLGFDVDYINQKYLINEIDRSVLSVTKFPFEKGDEIISVNGNPVSRFVSTEIAPYFESQYNERSKAMLSAFVLTIRSSNNLPVPLDGEKITFTIETMKDGLLKRVTLDWADPVEKKNAQVQNHKNFLGNSDMCNPISNFTVPANAVKVDGLPFSAFYFETEKGIAGFLKIPDFFPNEGGPLGEWVFKKWIKYYEKAIKTFQDKTDFLIIDQNFNCGGSISFVHKIVSMFASDSFMASTFSFRASYNQLETLTLHRDKYFTKGTPPWERFTNVITNINYSFNTGIPMSGLIPFWGFVEYDFLMENDGDLIAVNKVNYNKPVYILINEMSGSGGDLFPAMMKDLGRATLIGQPTMGAGGHVYDFDFVTPKLKHSEVNVRVTRSLFYRPSGTTIENNPVEPDYYYEPTLNDFLKGNEDYLKFILDKIRY